MDMPLFGGPVRHHTLNSLMSGEEGFDGLPLSTILAGPFLPSSVQAELIDLADREMPILTRNDGAGGFRFRVIGVDEEVRERLSLQIRDRVRNVAPKLQGPIRDALGGVLDAVMREAPSSGEIAEKVMAADLSGLDDREMSEALNMLSLISQWVVIRYPEMRGDFVARTEMEITPAREIPVA